MMSRYFKLVTTTDGDLYFGECHPKDGAIILNGCCMVEMVGLGINPLDIAYFGITKENEVNVKVTACVDSVSIFNPSLCIDMSDRAISSILHFIMRARNKDLIEHGGGTETEGKLDYEFLIKALKQHYSIQARKAARS